MEQVGIVLIPNKYRVSIADTNTDTNTFSSNGSS